MKRFAVLAFFFVLVLLFSACVPDPKTADIKNETQTEIPAVVIEDTTKSRVAINLPAMTENDILDLQQIRVYDDGNLIRTVYAEEIPPLYEKTNDYGSRGLDAKTGILIVYLEEGDHRISVVSDAVHGNCFHIDEQQISLQQGERIVLNAEEKKVSKIYIDTDVLFPEPIEFYVTVSNSEKTIKKTLTMYRSVMDLDVSTETEMHVSVEVSGDFDGYELDYDTVITVAPDTASLHPIKITNESIEANGSEIILEFNKNGCYNFFECMSVYFPTIEEANLVKADDTRTINMDNCYGVCISIIPDDFKKTVYAPIGLNLGFILSSFPSKSDTGESLYTNLYSADHYETKAGDSFTFGFSTSSVRGESAWVKVHVDALPDELLNKLEDLRFRLGGTGVGGDSLGGWSKAYIRSNLGTQTWYTCSVTPGKKDVRTVLEFIEGESSDYTIIADPVILDVKAGYKYNVSFKVVEINEDNTPPGEESNPPSNDNTPSGNEGNISNEETKLVPFTINRSSVITNTKNAYIPSSEDFEHSSCTNRYVMVADGPIYDASGDVITAKGEGAAGSQYPYTAYSDVYTLKTSDEGDVYYKDAKTNVVVVYSIKWGKWVAGLPSKEEMSGWGNTKAGNNGHGPFDKDLFICLGIDSYIWSGTEYNAESAWDLNLVDDGWFCGGKTGTNRRVQSALF